MKKKIAVFTSGWCGEILSEFLTGMQKTLEKEAVDIFLFLCYPTYIDSAANKQGELNIFSLPDIKDFDGVVFVKLLYGTVIFRFGNHVLRL